MDCLRTLRLVAGSLVLLAAGCGGSGGTADSGPPDTLQYLFVQTADSGSFEPSPDDPETYLLTLKGAQPVTTFFSDRPYRLAGIIETGDFIGGWNDESSDSFLRDPPNAALQIEGAPAGADVVIVELLDVQYDAASATLKYRAKIVRHADDSIELFHARGDNAENIPAAFGPASLFIDSWFSKAWHKVKKVAEDAAEAARKQAAEAAARLKKAEGDFEQAVKDTARTLDAMATNPDRILELSVDELNRLVAIALPGGMCVNVKPILTFDPIGFEPASTARKDWMTQMAPQIGARPLKLVAMPGSHDSGTYTINGASILSEEFGSGSDLAAGGLMALNVLRGMYPASYPVTATIARWSRAQRHTIGAQLAAGVRYFDLRIIPTIDGHFLATHGFAGADLDVMLQELASFLQAHPKEVVILDFQHLFSRSGKSGAMTAEDTERMLTKIRHALGDGRIVTDGTTEGTTKNPENMTLSEFWAHGLQVVLLFEEKPLGGLGADSQRFVWGSPGGGSPLIKGDHLDRIWPETTQWEGATGSRAVLDNQLAFVGSSQKLVVVQTQMTPTKSLILARSILMVGIALAREELACLKANAGIASGVVDSLADHLTRLTRLDVALSLQEQASHDNAAIRTWVLDKRLPRVVIGDFIADHPDLVDAIIDANNH